METDVRVDKSGDTETGIGLVRLTIINYQFAEMEIIQF